MFLTVLQKGSLTASAETLGYTTSGISISIAFLEVENGVTLLIMDRKVVCPTKETALFIPGYRAHGARSTLVYRILPISGSWLIKKGPSTTPMR